MTIRFKRLHLVDRVPEELWTEVHNIVQDAVIKSIQRKRNAGGQSSCWRSPYKQLRKEKTKAKEKRKERYIHLNAEFQRIARKDKKAFLNE